MWAGFAGAFAAPGPLMRHRSPVGGVTMAICPNEHVRIMLLAIREQDCLALMIYVAEL